MNKLLTIIIPSYNMEAYLERALTSLIVDDASMQLFEALVMNDGSKDRTSEIGHQFEAKYPDTFRVIDKENGHYGSCVNRGLKEAKGTFVKVLDADDRFDNEVFKQYLDFLGSPEVLENADLILSDLVEVDGNENRHKLTQYNHYTNPFTLADVVPYDRLNWFIHGITYRTLNLTKMGYVQTEGMAYTDNEWIFYPMVTIKRCYKFNGVLYLYSVGREGQSIEAKTHMKEIPKQVSLLMKMVESYPAIKEKVDAPVQEFMKERLAILLENIYHAYLVLFHKYNIEMSPLVSLDTLLKQDQYSDLYEDTDKFSILIAKMKFRPIHAWRNNKKVYLALMHLAYKFADTINKLRK